MIHKFIKCIVSSFFSCLVIGCAISPPAKPYQGATAGQPSAEIEFVTKAIKGFKGDIHVTYITDNKECNGFRPISKRKLTKADTVPKEELAKSPWISLAKTTVDAGRMSTYKVMLWYQGTYCVTAFSHEAEAGRKYRAEYLLTKSGAFIDSSLGRHCEISLSIQNPDNEAGVNWAATEILPRKIFFTEWHGFFCEPSGLEE